MSGTLPILRVLSPEDPQPSSPCYSSHQADIGSAVIRKHPLVALQQMRWVTSLEAGGKYHYRHLSSLNLSSHSQALRQPILQTVPGHYSPHFTEKIET